MSLIFLRRLSLLTAAALTMIAATPAWAQSQALVGDEVRECLCLQQSIADLRPSTETKRLELEAARNQLRQLEAEIDSYRDAMNPSDLLANQILKEMIERRDRLRGRLADELRPTAHEAITKLNLLVEDYNARCANRTMRKVDIDAAKKEACPIPE